MPKRISFQDNFQELLEKNILANKEEAWTKAMRDLEEIVEEGNQPLGALTNHVMIMRLDAWPKSEHVPGLGDAKLTRLILWNNAEEKSIGTLEVFKAAMNGVYPLVTAQGVSLGDREALQMVFYKIFGDPRSEIFNIIRTIQEAVK